MGVIIFTTLASCLILTVLFWKHFTPSSIATCQQPRFYPHRDGILGLDLIFKTANLMRIHQIIPGYAEWHKKLGETFLVNSLGTWVVHTLSPENIEVIFDTGMEVWGTSPARLAPMQPLCGAGFINSDGHTWQRSRALIQPAFTARSLENLAPFAAVVDDALSGIPADGKTFDLSPILEELFLDSAGQFLLGERLGMLSKHPSKTSSIKAREFIKSLHATQFWIGLRVVFGIVASYKFNTMWRYHRRIVHRFVDDHINKALKEGAVKPYDESKTLNKPPMAQSLVKTLLNQTPDRIEVRNHIIQSLMALQNKTSILVSNTFFLLSRNPETWERLRNDLDKLNINTVTINELRGISLLQNIFKEALRLYPVFGQLGRTAMRDTTLPSGGGPRGAAPIFTPAGTRTISSWYGLHRQRSIYGDDAESFDPDRWDHIEPGPWQYFGFGQGPRCCAGKDKALNEASYVLLAMAKKFSRIESRDTREWTGEWKLTVRNLHGCKIAVFA